MPPTITRVDQSHVATDPRRAVLGWVVAGLLALLVAVGAGEVLEPPATVDVTLVNETDRAVTVAVGSAEGGRLSIATLGGGEERQVREVLDQGSRWTIIHRFGGGLVEERVRPRAELVEQGFRIVVPATSGQ